MKGYRRGYYEDGFEDGYNLALREARRDIGRDFGSEYESLSRSFDKTQKRKRKLSAWNKYVKNKRNHITYRDGKLNLKKMAVAFRRKKRR